MGSAQIQKNEYIAYVKVFDGLQLSLKFAISYSKQIKKPQGPFEMNQMTTLRALLFKISIDANGIGKPLYLK